MRFYNINSLATTISFIACTSSEKVNNGNRWNQGSKDGIDGNMIKGDQYAEYRINYQIKSNIKQHNISNAAGISGVTLRNRFKDLKSRLELNYKD